MKFLQIAPALLPVALAQSSCDQYATFSGGNFLLSNNLWGETAGTGSGCITDVSLGGSAVWSTSWNWSGGDNDVKGYPNIALNVPNRQFITSISSMPTTAQWSYSGSSIRADVAYDLFTAADPNHVTYSGDYELMIWLGKFGDIQPIGSSQGTVIVGGTSWNLWSGLNGAMQVYSFVAPGNLTNWSGDVKNFYTYLQNSQGYPASSQYLLSYQFGTEAFTGSGALSATWTASIN